MTGLKKLLMLKAASGGGLPAEYQRVEYIESDGTQYIKLSDEFITGVSYTLVCQSENISSTQIFFGYSAYAGYWFGSKSGKYSISSKSFFNVSITDKVTAIITFSDKLYASINGTEVSEAYTNNYNSLTLFGVRGNSTWYYSHVKIFSLKADGLYDLIPCYRKSDGEIGMYNAVTKEFLTNSGTGTFIKGNDI